MRAKTILLLAIIGLAAVFLFINWPMLAAPARFKFLFGAIEIPMGMVIVGLLTALGLAFAVYMAVWQRGVLNDYRRVSQELRAQQQLADGAESSRFTALSTLMKEELAKLDQHIALELETLRGELHATENSISATLAEMDDRMRRGVQTPR
jgi:uncharacterized protein HemX